jgi:hypothetical protein
VSELPPELVRVSERLWLVPVCTLPKLRLTGRGVSEPGAMAVPESGMVTVGSVAVLEMATLPELVPADFGENTTLKLALWPAGRTIGKLTPLRLNAAPVRLAWPTVTAEPPELVKLTV